MSEHFWYPDMLKEMDDEGRVALCTDVAEEGEPMMRLIMRRTRAALVVRAVMTQGALSGKQYLLPTRHGDRHMPGHREPFLFFAARLRRSSGQYLLDGYDFRNRAWHSLSVRHLSNLRLIENPTLTMDDAVRDGLAHIDAQFAFNRLAGDA